MGRQQKSQTEPVKTEPAASVASEEQVEQAENTAEQQQGETADTTEYSPAEDHSDVSADHGAGELQKADKCTVVMTVPMAGIGLDWAVNSEQQLSPISAYRLVSAGNARYKSPTDAELAKSTFDAEQAAIEAEKSANEEQEAAE